LKFQTTRLPGVVLVEPEVHRDARGFFLETYRAEEYAEGGIRETFVQDNHSGGTRGILRGLHLQLSRPQGKLVRVIEGEVFDVAVDVRRGSPTFGCFDHCLLSADNFRQLYIPPNFAHGFVVMSEVAQFEYKCTNYYDPSSELTIAWNDPDIAIPWPIENPSLSEKDARGRRLCDLGDLLPKYSGDPD
jgi:dTDP-4-dehydrorhamnose 3,5-epimerase